MKKTEVDMLDFFKNGNCACLDIGQKAKKVRESFGKPCHIWDTDNGDTEIWTYGKLELFFYKNKLTTIFSDHFHEEPKKGLYGNKHVYIKPWIFAKPKKLVLHKVLDTLNKHGIDYQKSTHTLHVILKLNSGVKLTFENPKSKTDKQDCNNFILSAFCIQN